MSSRSTRVIQAGFVRAELIAETRTSAVVRTAQACAVGGRPRDIVVQVRAAIDAEMVARELRRLAHLLDDGDAT